MMCSNVYCLRLCGRLREDLGEFLQGGLRPPPGKGLLMKATNLTRGKKFFFASDHGATKFQPKRWVDLPNQTSSAPAAGAASDLPVPLQQFPATRQQQPQQPQQQQRPAATPAVTSATAAAAADAAGSRGADGNAAYLGLLQDPLGSGAPRQLDVQDLSTQQSAQAGLHALARHEADALPSQQADATAQGSSTWTQRQHVASTAQAQPRLQQRPEAGSFRGTSAARGDRSAGLTAAATEANAVPRQLSPQLSPPSSPLRDGLRQKAAGSVQAVLEPQQPDLTAASPLPSQPPPVPQPCSTQRSAVSVTVRASEPSTQPVSQLHMHATPPQALSGADPPQHMPPQQTQLPLAPPLQGATLPESSRNLGAASVRELPPVLGSQQLHHSSAVQRQQPQAHRQLQLPLHQQRQCQQGTAPQRKLRNSIEIPEKTRNDVLRGLQSAGFDPRIAKQGLRCALRELKPDRLQLLEARAVEMCQKITAERNTG